LLRATLASNKYPHTQNIAEIVISFWIVESNNRNRIIQKEISLVTALSAVAKLFNIDLLIYLILL